MMEHSHTTTEQRLLPLGMEDRCWSKSLIQLTLIAGRRGLIFSRLIFSDTGYCVPRWD